jgi:uncharacterized protein YndB with AHSA1/START domain
MSETVTVRRTIPASREELFDAWLDVESLRVFMCPPPPSDIPSDVRIDPRVGGGFEIVMHHQGQDYTHRGVYRVIDRPSRLEFTWISRGTDQGETLVTVEFHERDGQTEVVVTHQGLPSAESALDHSKGWGHILVRLDGVVS